MRHANTDSHHGFINEENEQPKMGVRCPKVAQLVESGFVYGSDEKERA